MIDWTSLSFEEARTILRKWREEHARHSDEAVTLWEHVLSRRPRALGDELWLVYEQVFIASLDTGRQHTALDCIKALQEKFGRSNRVLKLQAMLLEFLQKYDTASHLYEQLIESDPTNMSYRKRQIAILLAQGERQEAIRELNEYLKMFINDNEAWLELSNLYLQEVDHARAAHCLEELVLSNPHNSLFLRRLAEIRYTQGGQENIELAKSYFEHAIRTNPSCLRSLYGMIMCCTALLQKSSGQRKKDLAHSGISAADKLLGRYNEALEKGVNPNIELQIEIVRNLRSQLQS